MNKSSTNIEREPQCCGKHIHVTYVQLLECLFYYNCIYLAEIIKKMKTLRNLILFQKMQSSGPMHQFWHLTLPYSNLYIKYNHIPILINSSREKVLKAQTERIATRLLVKHGSYYTTDFFSEKILLGIEDLYMQPKWIKIPSYFEKLKHKSYVLFNSFVKYKKIM